ncbi:hypothetical protein SESBI_46904 [Sesbania bispinosa]|nr:hypothetical protein SESBI_46904 [Sesbania bispinosa]
MEDSLEGSTIVLEGEEEGNLELAKRSLVGRILWEKPLNRGAVKQILSKAWGEEQDDLKITDLGVNIFMFTFSDLRKAKGVMERGPWNVMGHLISLQYWVPQVSIHEIAFDWVTLWVQLHSLPLEFMTTRNVAKIAAHLGEVYEIEDPRVDGVLLRSFMRVRVAVNVKEANQKPHEAEEEGELFTGEFN